MNPNRILLVRPDRLGDILLSLPVAEALKKNFPSAVLIMLVNSALAPFIENFSAVDQVFPYEPVGRHQGWKGFWKLVSDLKKLEVPIAVVLQSPFRLTLALALARIELRVGPYSKLISYFVYHKGIRQNRSKVRMHEADYNLELLKCLNLSVEGDCRRIPVVPIPEFAKREVGIWFKNRGLKDSETLIAVHPGMGGSALNWPEKNYIELIRALVQSGKRVLVTAGPPEQALLERIRQALGVDQGRPLFFPPEFALNLNFLAAAFDRATVVVAPSTGPMHLAIALRKKVTTFFSPIRVQSAERWGPYPFEKNQAGTLVPDVFCGQEFKCKGVSCSFFPCMEKLEVRQALESVVENLKEAEQVLDREGNPHGQNAN